MKKIIVFATGLLLLVTLASCRGKEKSESEISRDLEKKGTTEVLQEASKDNYDPPADGRLSEDQIQMYLKVRDHEREIAKVARKELESHAEQVKEKGDKSLGGIMEAMKGVGSLADFATADIRAAQELGYNTAEYTWVKGKVLEASGAALTEKLHSNMRGSIEKAYAETKKQYERAKDETSRKMLGEMLKGYEAQMSSFDEQQNDPVVSYNRELLSKFEDQLGAITSELSKFEDNEGTAAKAMHDLDETSEPPQ